MVKSMQCFIFFTFDYFNQFLYIRQLLSYISGRNERGEYWETNQTQLGGFIITEHNGNMKQEKPYMDIRGRVTQDMGTQD